MEKREYINNKVYAKVASQNGVTEKEVEGLARFVSSVIANVILDDNPKVSVKLDYLGNILSVSDKVRGRIDAENRKAEERLELERIKGLRKPKVSISNTHTGGNVELEEYMSYNAASVAICKHMNTTKVHRDHVLYAAKSGKDLFGFSIKKLKENEE